MSLRTVAAAVFIVPGAARAAIGAGNLISIGGMPLRAASIVLLAVSFASVVPVIIRGPERGDELSRTVFGDAAFSAIGCTLAAALAMLVAYLVWPSTSITGALVFVMGIMMFSLGVFDRRGMGDEDACLDD